MTIAFIDSVHPLLAERLTAAGHSCIDLHTASDAELRHQLSDVEGIVVRSRQLGEEVLSHAPRLRVVGRVGAGLENIDTAWCKAKGISVYNSP
ncbi:MAG: hypothetical protein IPN85_16430 [Flavobacteriales bacterium]|nr:hypothetical protein [Flavobacteriales bacterium]